jgi:hypothetical protein
MHPDIFYKYASSSTVKAVLESGRLRWSSPVEFNDLSEFKRMPVCHPPVEQEWDKYLELIVNIVFDENKLVLNELSPQTKTLISALVLLRKQGLPKSEILKEISIPCTLTQEHMTDALRKFTEDQNNNYARVLCLTEDYKNEVMWAHYAEEHKGCVLGFKDIPKLDTPYSAARKVKYTDGAPIICSGLEFLLYGDTIQQRRKTSEAIFYSKDEKWSYESEWRLITWRPDEKDCNYADYKFYLEELESITFGVKTSNTLINDIEALLNKNYSKTEIYKMQSKHGELSRIQLNG